MIIKQSIFLMYDGIVKDPRENILRFLMEDHEESPMGEIFPVLDTLKDFEKDKINGLIMSSTRFNILEFLHMFRNPGSVGIDNLPILEDLSDIYYSRVDLYDNLPLLPMGEAVNNLLLQNFVESIFFYTPYEDERIVKDIALTYGADKKVNYIFGDIIEILKENNFQSFIINDLEIIKILKDLDLLENKDIMIADYNYLYNTDIELPTLMVDGIPVDDIERDKKCKIKLFRPRKIDDYNDDWIIQEDK